MATITASMTLASDIHSQPLSISASTTLYKDGTENTGLLQMNYHRAVIPTGTNFDLIQESAALNTHPANYLYIINKNTPVDDFVIITMKDEIIGSLYGGDWMFIPYSNSVTDTAGASDQAGDDTSIEISANTNACTIEYALFHSGETLITQADS